MLALLCFVVLLLIVSLFYILYQKRSIEKLKEDMSEMVERHEQIDQALQACHIFPWVYCPETRLISYLSKGRSKYYPDDLTVEYFSNNFIEKEYRQILLSALDDAAKGRDTFLNVRIKMTPVDKQGHEWAHVIGVPVGWNKKKQVASRIVGILHYISKEVEQEEELKRNKDFLELTMRTANIIPWEYLLDKDLLISKTPSQAEMTKPILMSAYIQRIVHPDWREGYAHEVQAVKDGKRGNYFDYKLKALNSAGDYEWIRIVGVVINSDVNGKPLRMIGSTYQIDQEMRREEQLNQLRNAEEANRLKTAFLANISHEVRTPLNAIVGFSQLLVESPESSGEFLPIIEENTRLLLKLIGDILDISRIESGDMQVEMSNVDLNELLGNARSMYACQLNDDVSISASLPKETFILVTDKNCLMQILHNLLSNAVKFTREGAIVIGYNIGKDQSVRFFVRDTGIGIDPKNHAYIFERFSKVDSFVQGAGLGLSICEMIVKLLDGRIGVTSELGKGSEFWFTIPVKAG